MVFQRKVSVRINFLAQHGGPAESHREYYGGSGGDSLHGLVVMVTTRCKRKGWWCVRDKFPQRVLRLFLTTLSFLENGVIFLDWCHQFTKNLKGEIERI